MIRYEHKTICLTVPPHLEVYKKLFGYLCGSSKLYQSSFIYFKIEWGEVKIYTAETMVGGASAQITAHETLPLLSLFLNFLHAIRFFKKGRHFTGY